MKTLKQKEISELEAKGYDLGFIARTQPQGNVIPHADYIQIGDTYVTCLRIWKYPPHGLEMFWGVPLVSGDSTYSVISLGTENHDQVVKWLDRSTSEQATRVSGKAKASDNSDAIGAVNDQMTLLNMVKRHGEVLKRTYWRLFVYANTLDELHKRVAKVKQDHTEFSMSAYAEEQLYDFQSVFVPPMSEEKMPNSDHGIPISAYALGGSYLFNHVKLDDPRGTYFGYTKTNGEVMWDPFYRDRKRTRSFFLELGNPGMGKSGFGKKINDDVFSRGAWIRNFDLSHEYEDQTIGQGGIVIPLDSPKFKINLFQVFPTVTSKNGDYVDQASSFDANTEKLKNVLQFLNNKTTDDDLTTLETWITDFYINEELWIKNARKHQNVPPIAELSPEKYPTLSEFVTFIKQAQRNAITNAHAQLPEYKSQSMDRIVNAFSTLLVDHGDLFDGPTLMPALSSTQVIDFDYSGLVQGSKAIFNIQFYQVLSLMSQDIVRNGTYYREALRQKKITTDDIRWYYLNFDEVENVITPRFPFGVEFLAKMMEQMRKNMCAINMIAPTIKDIILDGTSSATDPYVIAVRKIFGLMQIIFNFQTSDVDLPSLRLAYGGSSTHSELQSLTKLRQGEVNANISGDRNIQFTVQLTDEERYRYDGGL
ncbi:MAG TPA: conjugal transfer protein [Lactobacillus sp.]|nr:conjugal transfer protein [Lactobacillus sp.]